LHNLNLKKWFGEHNQFIKVIKGISQLTIEYK